MFCKNCGNEIKENEKYCGKCGFKVEDVTFNNTSNNTIYNKEPIKIKFSYFLIGIIIILCIYVCIIFFYGKQQPIKSVEETFGNNANKYENELEQDSTNAPIYIGKKYIAKTSDLTYYMTFTSTTQFKYIAKDNHGLIDDIVLYGTYEIEDNTIKTVCRINGTYSRDTYTIIDKGTIKSKGSNPTTYKVSDN